MSQKSKLHLHSRNKNKLPYDLLSLLKIQPKLKSHVTLNKIGKQSINFSDSRAVKLLNEAILNHYYGIKHWEFPEENLTPPIPGRADYIHHIADVLAKENNNEIPFGDKITCLDIGVGASCIYPIIGVVEYGWNFIGVDVNKQSLESAEGIIAKNPTLKGKIKLRLQSKKQSIFKGIIKSEDQLDITICNPPFHATKEDALKGTRRKVKNLTGKNTKTPVLNFAGAKNELVYKGGELAFIQKMIEESKLYSKHIKWFSTLVSKQLNKRKVVKYLEQIGAKNIIEIPMQTGNKITRIIAWSFISK
ncbi:23S rRNA (adenine(1618)-N(6))-methyltransferase RlmF [Brumimicrobium salinarum]|uniref:Ribosomal RNA large subunit methyltransferase F n=1 Tax=Brumimicrobium salinarum TaxID=2058658 RepID=A0A2I0R246_9FLAO|nr:23S rRNA (adenine(1618)-N(6))-methyltransferase RlmF [Brumimicrobium salinarum]PKR80646.1 23S rRNA (adenine(1618)-N(6))-methyltransferase RlmF [Brumimicrobium salinarum]